MDNMYDGHGQVATDNGVANKNKLTAMRDVVITVKNAEEAGTVMLVLGAAQGWRAVYLHAHRSRRHGHRREVGVASKHTGNERPLLLFA